jgi:hypothetical protein
MRQELNTSKTSARPSHAAVEDKVGERNRTGGTEEQKVDRAAMKGAKRAENRIVADEENIPGSTIFSK